VAQKLSLIFANASFVSKPVKVLVKIFDFLKLKKKSNLKGAKIKKKVSG
jgi:hypothetical protein